MVFSNPQIPYSWEGLENIQSGFFCVFNQEFFRQFGTIDEYPIFKIGGIHLFELTDEQAEEVINSFQKMQEEIQTTYLYKYDVLRTQVMELIHFAMKMHPSLDNEIPQINASNRIATLFMVVS